MTAIVPNIVSGTFSVRVGPLLWPFAVTTTRLPSGRTRTAVGNQEVGILPSGDSGAAASAS